MGNLAKLLSQPTAQESERTTAVSIDDDGDYTYSQTLVLDRHPETPRAMLELFGHDPEAFMVVGETAVTHRELVDGRVVSSYRYKLRALPQPLDIDALVASVRKARKHRQIPTGGDYWFVFQAGDLQIGKRSRDGATEEIVTGYLESLERAVDEFKNLRRLGIEGIQISMPGDCMEGVVSQNGKNAWLTEQTMPEQTRIFRRLLMQTVQTFAPLTNQLYLDITNGNHDESQRQWNTYPGDGWATECAVSVDDALKMNPDAYGHVTVRIPDKWSGHMTVPVGDSIVTVVHGHQFGRETNGLKWWQEQTFGNHPPSSAHVMQNGHFHEVALERAGERTRMQSPTFDMGSDWYREQHGCGNTRGALVYLLSAGEVSRLSVV